MIAKQRNPIRKIFTILLLLLVGSAFAQTSFVQSRFSGMPSDENEIAGECNDCQPSVDGVLEYRIAMEELESDRVNTTATYNVQMRIIGGNTITKGATRLAFASARLTYNTDAFGKKAKENNKCDYDVVGAFAEQGKGYSYTFNDTTDDSFTITAYTPARTTTASNLVQLSETFQDFVKISCNIENSDQDAGVAISGTDITANMIYVYSDANETNTNISARRGIFPLVHNSLRGFRLDEKTWVRDYSRYGDGRGVRLEFSKGIDTQLTEANFTLDATTATTDSVISKVNHNSGSNYAEIEFSQAIGDDILRLVSSSPTVKDADNGELADGNFVAALFYDSVAPRVTAIAQNTDFSGPANRTEWILTFSSAISPSTVNKDSLCVAEMNGICVAEGMTPTIPIIGVRTDGDSPTTLTVVVDQTAGFATGGMRSIEFRRNAIQGATNFKVVEDYQPALRDAVILQQDTTAPEITVARVRSDGTPASASDNLIPVGDNYVMYFQVTANEDVESLDDLDSYQLQDNTGTVVDDAVGSIHSGSGSNRSVILRYTILVSSATSVTYFTVVRSNVATSLQDVASNQPVDVDRNPIANGGIITNAPSARAPRDTTGPIITVGTTTIMPTSSGLKYIVTFEINANESVPTIAEVNSYTVTREGDGNEPSVTDTVDVVANDAMTAATVTYTAAFGSDQYADVRATTGWTLGFVSGALLDVDRNAPTLPDSPLASRDTTAPQITIAGSPTLTLDATTATASFVVVADKAVETLDEGDSYQLYRFEGGPGSPVSGATAAIDPRSDNRRTTLTYVVALSDQEVIDTESFGLYRAEDNTKLLDNSGNLPVQGDGSTLIATDTEIDSTRRAVKETEGAMITVAIVDQVDADNDVEAEPNPNDGSQYTIGFTITNTEHSTKPIGDLATTTSYTILRRVGSNNLNTTITVVSGAGSEDSAGVATLEFVVSIADQATTEMTDGFVLARANNADALLDRSGNPPRLGTTPIGVGAVIDASVIARRDTTAPNLTVSPSTAETDDGKVYTFSFEVTREEAVRGFSITSSYSLLVAEKEENVMSGFQVVSGTNPSVEFSEDRPTTAVVKYSVDVDDLQSNLSIASTYGFMLGRAGGGLRDLANNDPVQSDAAGDRTATEVADGQPLQLGQVVVLDRVSPSITVSADSIAPVPATVGRYTMSFTTTATEAVRNIAQAGSYRLMRVRTDNTWEAASETAMQEQVSVGMNNEVDGLGTSATFTYTITFTGEAPTRLANIRGTRGFTLALVSGENQVNLRDIATNLPVKSNGDAIYDTDGTTLLNDGIIAPISGGVIVASAVAARDTTGPDLTVASIGNAVPGATAVALSGRFTVGSTEAIRDINSTASYSLLRIPLNSDGSPNDGGAVLESSATFTVSSGSNLSQSVTIDFTAVLDDVVQVRGTYGFTLASAIVAGGGLRDIWGNAVVAISAEQNRLTAGNNAVVAIEKVPPQITIAGSPTLTLDADTATATFVVLASEDVETLDEGDSYQLYRFEGGTGSPVSGATATIDPRSDNRRTTLTYVVTLTAQEVMDTESFGLYRAEDNTKLLDNSGNLPVQGDGSTLIATGTEIDSTRRAVKETEGAMITVAIVDQVDADNDVEADPNPNDGNQYTIGFTVTNTDHGTQSISDLATTASYTILRRVGNSNLNTTITVVSGTGSDNGAGVATLEFVVSIADQATTEMTDGFVLARANNADALLDSSGNPPRLGTTPIGVGAVIDASVIARRDTTAPNLTVSPSTAETDDGKVYTFSFEVTREEAVRGFSITSSYSLLVAEKEENVMSGFQVVSGTNPSVEFSEDRPTTAVFEYSVDVDDLQSNLSIASTYGFMLGRAGGGLRDLANNDPVQSDAAGDRTATEVADGQPLQLGQVVVLDRVSPSITVSADSIAPVPATVGRYTMSFTTTATEAVRNIAQAGSYRLMRVRTDNTWEAASLTASQEPVSVGMNNEVDGLGTSATFTYTITFTGEAPTRLANIRGTRGFTLALVSGENQVNLRDIATNLPVKSNGDAIYDTDGTTLLDDGIIAPISGGVIVASAVAARDTTGPDLTVASIGNAVPGATAVALSGRFTVGSTEAIRDINSTASYSLLRIPLNSDGSPNDGGAVLESSATFTVSSGSNLSQSVTIDFTAVLDDVVQVRGTYGFTLASAIVAGGGLRDIWGNAVVAISAEQNRLTAGNNAVVAIEKVPPQITIAGSPTLTLDADTATATFVVLASEDVETLDEGDSYQLYRFEGGTGSPVSGATATIDPRSDNRRTTLTYVVTLTAQQVIDTESFGLYRAEDNTKLLDNSGNLPVQGDGSTLIATGTEIDSTRRAVKETEGAMITVAIVDQVDADNDVEADPNPNDGNQYTIGFTVTNTDHGTQPIDDLATTASYTILRRVGNSNLNTTITVVSGTGSDNGAGVATLEFVVSIADQATTEMTDGFVLARANNADALLDSSGNPPRLGTTPIGVGAVIDASVIARRDTTAPNLTVSPSTAETDDGKVYTFSFEVTREEAVRGFSITSSYSLLVAEKEENVMSGFQVAGGINPSVEFSEDRPTTAVFEYSVDVDDLQSNLSIVSTYGFMLGRAGGGLRDLANNDPVQSDAAGDRTTTEVADGQPLQLGQVVLLDRVSPSITVSADSIAPVPATVGRYTMSFTTTATEAVRNIAQAGSYRLMRVRTDNTWEAASLTASQEPVSVGMNNEVDGLGTSATFTYTITFTGEAPTRLANIRGTRGFTLALVSGENQVNLRDIATNLPVKSNGDAIYDTDGTTLLDDGIIAPISGGVIVASAVAARDTTGPDLTVASIGNAVPGATAVALSGRFTVGSTEAIRDINSTASYSLLRIPLNSDGSPNDGGAVLESSATFTVSSGSNLSQSVTIDFTAVLDDVVQVRGTYGFTLASAIVAGGGLRDIWGNAVVAISAEQNRLTAGNNAVVAIEKVPPQITIAGSPTLTLDATTATATFVVLASEDVETLDEGDSYQLYRFEGGSGSPVSGATATIDPRSDNRRTTLTYVVTLTAQQVIDTESFGLYRAEDNTKLLDNSGNLPVQGDGSTLIATGTEIDSTRRAVKETEGAMITVAIVDQVDADNDVEAEPNPNDGNQYTIGFTVTNTDHGTQPIDDLATTASYTILRRVGNSNLNTTITVVSGTGSEDSAGVATLEFVVSIADQATTEMTDGFVLARANNADALLDSSGNPPRLGTTPIGVGAVIDASVIARRDTTAPNLTVSPSTAETDDGKVYTFSFEVTREEAVRGFSITSSYSLLVAEKEENVMSGFQVAGGINPSVEFSEDRPTTAVFEYSVDVDDLQSNLSIVSTYGFMLGRAGGGLRDLANNDPVQSDAAGDRTTTEVADGQPLQLGQVVLLDRVSPSITVSADSIAPVPATVGRYTMSFTTTATEAVRNIAQAGSYRLMRVKTDNTWEAASETAMQEQVSVGMNNEVDGLGTSATFTYTITFTGEATTRLANIRDTRGFTLALVSGENQVNLRDIATNLPVKSNGDNIYDADGTTLLDDGIIAPISGGVIVASAVAARDTTGPDLTVASIGNAVPGATAVALSGRFTVGSTEAIRDINSTASYSLLRIPLNSDGSPNDGGAVLESSATFTVSSGTNLSQSVTIDFTAVLDDVVQVRGTYGFTLASAIVAGGGLRDIWGNAVVAISAEQNRLTAGNNAVVAIEKVPPQINVVADGVAVPVAETNGTEYTVRFNVDVQNAEEVKGLGDTSSYNVIRIGDSGNTTATAVSGNSNADNTTATLVYEVAVASPVGITGFTLAGGSDVEALRDNSGNLAVQGSSTTTKIATGVRIDDDGTALAQRDTMPPAITVVAGADDAVLQAQAEAGNTYRMMFTVTVADDDNVPSLNTTSSYQLVRIFKDGRVPELVRGATVEAADNVFTYTAMLTTDIEDTEGFTLARSSDETSLLDASGNMPVKNDGTTMIAIGDVIAPIDDDGQVVRSAIARTPRSDDDTLIGLVLRNLIASALTDIELDPDFTKDQITYTASVIFSVSSVEVTPTANSAYATIMVNGEELTDSTSNVVLNNPAEMVETEVAVKVIAEDDITSQTYTIAIMRAATESSDARLRSLSLDNIPFTFNPSTNTYSITVNHGVEKTTVTAMVFHPGARVTRLTLDGTSQNDPAIDLKVGSNVIAIRVIAEDTSPSTYTITITRLENNDTGLRSLSLDNIPFTFNPSTRTYEIMVGEEITETTVTAVVSFNGAMITDLTVNDNAQTFTVGTNIEESIALNTDNTVIEITVTAANSTTDTYTLTITRAQPPVSDIRLRIKVFLEGPLQ